MSTTTATITNTTSQKRPYRKRLIDNKNQSNSNSAKPDHKKDLHKDQRKNQRKDQRKDLYKHSSNKNHERDYASGYKHYLNLVSSIPEHLLRKLDNMPHNRGYIWKDMWMFGAQPETGDGTRMMFEKKGRDLLIIHEWKDGRYRVYEKYGRDSKVLVNDNPIRKKFDTEKLKIELGL